jgi:hypothetical protein
VTTITSIPRFKLASFTDGDVYCTEWAAPRPGQKVGLDLDVYGNLQVHLRGPYDDQIPYTWPRGKNLQEASLLAWRHYQRHAR